LTHVKSTAPSTQMLGYKQPQSIYFALRSRGRRQRRQRRQQRKRNLHESDSEDEEYQDEHDSFDHEEEEEEEQEPAVVQAVNDFMIDMQVRLRRTKQEWSKRLDDFSRRVVVQEGTSPSNTRSSFVNGSSTTMTEATISPFRVLLQLFADQDNTIFGQLSAAFDLDQGQTMTFFVPQLLSFLLHGATTSSVELEDWILQKCRQDIQFAHRCYWFLRAWCLEVPGETSAAAAAAIISRQNSETQLAALESSNGSLGASGSNAHRRVPSAGSAAQLFLDQPTAETTAASSSSNLCLPSAGADPNGASAVSDDKFLPQERAMIERLMLRVKECGESAARGLEYGAALALANDENDENSSDPNSRRTIDSLTSSVNVMNPSTLMQVVEMGAVPVDPSSGRPSQRHLDCMAASQKYGFLPMTQLQQQLQQFSKSTSPSDTTEHFDKTPQFLDSLIFIAETLFHVPRESRKEELQNMLRQLECELLPDNAIYVPSRRQPQGILGRVWRVAVAECIPISTKERVPCIIPLEVVLLDHDGSGGDSGASPSLAGEDLRKQFSRLKDKEWSFLDHLPTSFLSSPGAPFGESSPRNNNSLDQLSQDFALSTPGSLHRVTEENVSDMVRETSGSSAADDETSNVSPYSLRRSSLVGASAVSSGELSEADLVNEWRTRPRNPHRFVPLINKVAETMKGTMDRMKTTVQKGFNELRDRSVNEELKGLTANAETTSSPNASPSSLTRLISDGDEDDEDGHDIEMDHGPSVGFNGSATSNTNLPTDGILPPPAIPPLSPRIEPPPTMPMGQWSSPSPSAKRKVMTTTSLRRRSETKLASNSDRNEITSATKESLSLPYGSGSGSDQKNGKRRSSSKGKESFGDSELAKKDPSGLNKSVPAKPPPVVFKESWQVKQERVRQNSAYGSHPGWRLFPILIKANDDLRQEELASQIIYRMASILAREKVPVWLCPYDIIALTDRGGIIEAIPDTISIDSLKRNDPEYTNLRDFFANHHGEGTDDLSDAKANFVESLAAYSMVCFLLQIKDRHNGNILIDSRGHVIHIDFGFFFLSSPGKNAGFESAPFKLTRDFVEVLEGPHSHLFHIYRELCVRSFLALRKHCMEIILLVEMLKNGNENLACFRGRPNDAIQGLRDRFRLDLNDRACREYVNSLIDDSIENWRTDWYDRYQRYFVGVL